MNIVFLDIDGVLNSMPYFESIKGKRSRTHNEIDERHLPYLQRIVKENNAHIVLSSTWRDLDDINNPTCYAMWQYLIDTLAKYDLTIMSKTPIIDQIRPLEIKTWLANRKDNIKWISIEDDWNEELYEEYGIGGHLIETKFYPKDISEAGLLEKHVELAKELFDKQ